MSFLPAEIIKKKRNGNALSDAEISFFISEYTRGSLPDYQMSAWLMAIYFKSMTDSETLSLTKSMLHSGQVMDLSYLPGFKADKHSTGGVGDKTSLILGPIVAACGVKVPMISGRGLGHTGGTLDKLESIPGFNTQLDLETFKKVIQKIGVCFIGQTKEICPADKKIYALRDVTATIESFPLICASIMSKKLAEGIDGLVLDVKFGSGAFVKTHSEATELAKRLLAIAHGYGKKASALITNMNQPLGRFSGNSLEVQECLDIMQGKSCLERGRDFYSDTRELSVELAAEMLHLAEFKSSLDACRTEARKVLASGAAMEKFVQLCEAHGGNLMKLPKAPHQQEILAGKNGFVARMNTESIGVAGIHLGAGRSRTTDMIVPTSGIEFHVKVGDTVRANEKMFTLHGPDSKLFPEVSAQLLNSVEIQSEKVMPEGLIHSRLSG